MFEADEVLRGAAGRVLAACAAAAARQQGTTSVVVTGAAGNLGLSLSRYLAGELDRDPAFAAVHLVCVDVAVVRDELLLRHPRVTAHVLDLGNAAQRSLLPALLTGCVVVVHCAASPGYPRYGFYGGRALCQAVNVDGTRALLEAAGACGVSAFVLCSSINICFDGSGHLPDLAENSVAVPRHWYPDHYSRSKAQQEGMVLAASSPGLRTCSLRPTGMYGPPPTPGIHIPRILLRYVRPFGGVYCTMGGLARKADWLYHDNMCQALLLAAAALLDSAPGVGGEAFHVSDGAPINYYAFFRPLIEAAGFVYRPVVHIPWWVMLVLAQLMELLCLAVWYLSWGRWRPHPELVTLEVLKCATDHYFCIDKARRVLGYRPLPPAEAMRRTIAGLPDLPGL